MQQQGFEQFERNEDWIRTRFFFSVFLFFVGVRVVCEMAGADQGGGEGAGGAHLTPPLPKVTCGFLI